MTQQASIEVDRGYPDEVFGRGQPCEPLAIAARSGDPAAFSTLVEHLRPSLRAMAQSVTGDLASAEDAVQDAVLVAMTRRSELRDARAFGAWLRTITRNRALAHLRYLRRLQPLTAASDGSADQLLPEEVAEAAASQRRVRDAVEALPERLRLVVLMRFFSTQTDYATIAAACGIPIGTVRSRLNEARRRLAALLSDDDDQAALTDAHRDQRGRDRAFDFIERIRRGQLSRAVNSTWGSRIKAVGPSGADWTRAELVGRLRTDFEHGVVHELVNVQVSGELEIWETHMKTTDREYCTTTGALWIQTVRDDQVQRLRLVAYPSHAVRSAA